MPPSAVQGAFFECHHGCAHLEEPCMSADSLWTDFAAPALPVLDDADNAVSLVRLLAIWFAITALCAGLGVLLADLSHPASRQPAVTVASAPLAAPSPQCSRSI
jgi:hypothetical protein